MGYIQKGKEEGATVVTGGERHGEEGYFIQPTIFTNVTPSMTTLYRQESFGPIACIIPFKTTEEVIEMANDTTYGLASGVFTKDLNTAMQVSNNLVAGTVFVSQSSENCLI